MSTKCEVKKYNMVIILIDEKIAKLREERDKEQRYLIEMTHLQFKPGMDLHKQHHNHIVNQICTLLEMKDTIIRELGSV